MSDTSGSLEGREGVALALSGGGFRAMLFHLGSVWRLNELGMLQNLDRISGVSGGSIFLGRLASAWTRLEFEDGIAVNFREEIAEHVIRFSGRTMDVQATVIGLLTPLSASRLAARQYRRLMGNSTLQDLPDRPRFVFNASHFPTATNWRFSKPYMGTYRLGLVNNPRVELAVAVAASAAFPPFLSPLTLHLDPESYTRVEGADLFDDVGLRRKVPLTDGGVYDNLGLQTVQDFQTILSSDAGGLLTLKPGGYRLWHTQLFRAYDTASEQARATRRHGLMEQFLAKKKEGTLWRTGTDIRKYPVTSPFEVDPGWRLHLATIRTRLNRFGEEERARLINWGYLVADVALRSYVMKAALPPQVLPFPRFGFADSPG